VRIILFSLSLSFLMSCTLFTSKTAVESKPGLYKKKEIAANKVVQWEEMRSQAIRILKLRLKSKSEKQVSFQDEALLGGQKSLTEWDLSLEAISLLQYLDTEKISSIIFTTSKERYAFFKRMIRVLRLNPKRVTLVSLNSRRGRNKLDGLRSIFLDAPMIGLKEDFFRQVLGGEDLSHLNLMQRNFIFFPSWETFKSKEESLFGKNLSL
jgi:hypothetical protein